MNPIPRLSLLLTILVALLGAVACTRAPQASPEQQQVFAELWEAIDENYVYEDFNGVDWPAARERYQTVIDSGLDDEAFWASMREMVSLLGDDHTVFHSPTETAEMDQLRGGELGYVGIGVFFRALPHKNYAVVLFPFPGGPAERAGIAPHDRLLVADGKPLCCDERGEARVDLVLGPEGTAVDLTVQTPGQEPRRLTLTRAPIQADFPVIARRLPDDIGYLLVPDFQARGIARKTEAAWRELAAGGPLQGLVLDLRTCQGGDGEELVALLELFADGDLGYFGRRHRRRSLVIQGRDAAGSQSVPLVVLVGEITESFGEVMAGVMQETGRAVLVGAATAGNVEAAHRHDFSDGSSAWIAQETFFPPSGARWEAAGVRPDHAVPLGWDEFAGDEDDLVLQTAVALLAVPAR